MPSTNEVISLVNAADTAVRTACVLDLLVDSRPLPPFADKAVERAIAMLDDALLGSALLTGGNIQGFSGDLNALCWATDGYVAERAAGSARPDPAEVEKSLKQIRQEMDDVRARIHPQSTVDSPGCSFDTARRFFDTLAKLLAQRATGSLTRPSLNYSSPG